MLSRQIAGMPRITPSEDMVALSPKISDANAIASFIRGSAIFIWYFLSSSGNLLSEEIKTLAILENSFTALILFS